MNDEALKILKSALRDSRITSQEDSEQWTALQKIRAIDKLIKVYTIEFEEMLEKYELLESEWNLLKPQIREALSKWNELEPKIETAIHEWDTLKPMVEQVMNLWAELYPTITALLSEWEELKPEIESALSEWGDFKPQVQTIINDWQTIQPQWIYIKNEWDDVKRQIQSLFNDWEEMQTEFTNMITSWSNIQTEWNGYQDTWSTMQEQWTGIKNEWQQILITWEDMYDIIANFENMIRNISLSRKSIIYYDENDMNTYKHIKNDGGPGFKSNRVEVNIKQCTSNHVIERLMGIPLSELEFVVYYNNNTDEHSQIDISEIIGGLTSPTTKFYPEKLSGIRFECSVIDNVVTLVITMEDMKGKTAIRRTTQILSGNYNIADVTVRIRADNGNWFVYSRY